MALWSHPGCPDCRKETFGALRETGPQVKDHVTTRTDDGHDRYRAANSRVRDTDSGQVIDRPTEAVTRHDGTGIVSRRLVLPYRSDAAPCRCGSGKPTEEVGIGNFDIERTDR